MLTLKRALLPLPKYRLKRHWVIVVVVMVVLAVVVIVDGGGRCGYGGGGGCGDIGRDIYEQQIRLK